MAIVNMAERKATEVKRIMAKIKAEYKKTHGADGTMEHSVFLDTHLITLVNNLGGFDDMRSIVKDSEFAKFQDYGHRDGIFDWASGVYFRDYSWVKFTF